MKNVAVHELVIFRKLLTYPHSAGLLFIVTLHQCSIYIIIFPVAYHIFRVFHIKIGVVGPIIWFAPCYIWWYFVSVVFTPYYLINDIYPANTKHLYNICTTSAQRLWRWLKIVQMLYNFLCLLDNQLFSQTAPTFRSKYPPSVTWWDVRQHRVCWKGRDAHSSTHGKTWRIRNKYPWWKMERIKQVSMVKNGH